ncbi:hypothetical protein [Aquabacter cavernae]|uniref:hypothetical protein n=1 Tax=Aquabacter cavernae TaxID=2496029 RepID=UPI000F8D1CB0|nr:hypothetical protein [Aquabacter cavernae]
MQDASAKIEIRVERIAQLLNMLDPYPFQERDLDPQAEAFIVEWAGDLPAKQPLAIVLHLPAEEAGTDAARAFGQTLNHFFRARAEEKSRELKELFRMGRIALAIGLAVLAACILLSELISGRLGDRPFAHFVSESLIILGWVANWRPIEIFLYDWWPLVRDRRLYRRLAQARVEIRAAS